MDNELLNETFTVDYRALMRLINNLLSNARVHAKQTIKIQFYNYDSQCFLVVEDDGPGIDKSKWQDVFTPFTQLDNNQRDGSKGHGLGLAIVQQIAMWHKGEITVNRSQLGGAKFTASWPI